MKNTSRFDSHRLIDNRQVRIFLSSTFSDMQKERSGLLKTFEVLKVEAAKRNVSLSVVDLRWGVTDDEARTGKVISVCLNEIENSHPFFIGLLGNNYGTSPDMSELDKNPELKERYPWIVKDISKGMSLTEMEMQYAVLRNKAKLHAAFFIKKSSKTDNNSRLKRLKKKIERGYNPQYYERIPRLCRLVSNTIRGVLDELFLETETITPLDRERTAQRAYINSRHSCYYERGAYNYIIDSFVYNKKQRHLVFTGESGIGKSALLANWIKKNEKNPDFNLVYHFVGNSFSGNSFENILRHLCDEIYDLYALKREKREGESAEEEARRLVADVCQSNKKLVIIIDGINQIAAPTNEKLLLWLPAANKNVKYIFSTLPDDKTMQTFSHRGCRVKTVQPLTSSDRKKWIPKYLIQVGKKLDDKKRQVERIADCNLCNNTLMLKTLLDELICFGIHEQLDARIDYYLSSYSITDFFNRVLQRMEKDYSAGKDLVRHALTLIFLSEHGLSEYELVELLGCKERPLDWNLFYCAFYNHFVVRNGLITFAHQYIADAVVSRYDLNNKMAGKQCRQEIISYFSSRQTRDRSKSELAFQYYQTSDWDNLHHLLLDFGTFRFFDSKDQYLMGTYWRALVEADKGKYRLSAYFQLPHLRNAELSLLLNEIAYFAQFVMADYRTALDLYQKSLEIAEEIFGPSHPETSTGYNNIGNLYDNIGEYSNALKYYKKDYRICKKLVGDKHPDTAISLNNIGETYRIQGKYKMAKRYHKKALKTRIEALGVNHPQTAQSYNNLGLVYFGEGDFQTALKYHLVTLKINEHYFGEEHPETSTSYFDIGMDYEILGDEQKALEYYLKDLSICKKYLGESHPSTADAYNNIGELCRKNQDYKNAMLCHKKALAIRENAYGRIHKFTAQSYNNIGLVYLGLIDYESAMTNFSNALNIWIELFGEYSQDVSLCYNNIGLLLDSQGDPKKALRYLHKALKIQKKILAKDHYDIAITYNNIASTYLSIGEKQEALNYYRKSMEIFEKQLDVNAPYVLITREQINNLLT